MNMNFIFNEKETQTIYSLVKAFDKNRKESKLYAGKVSESSNNIYFMKIEKLEEGMNIDFKVNEDFYVGFINIITNHAKKIKKICKHVSALISSILALNSEIERDFKKLVTEIGNAV